MKLKTEIRLITAVIFAILFQIVESVIYSASKQNPVPIKNQYNHLTKSLVPKASLTQKGYIQFLRYVVDVPEIIDYTFCIWVRSNNLTYNHPLLSYSKHEEERLIRVWISPSGSHINLDILEIPIFRIPVHFVENEWYHICQSWSSSLAAWSFYLNGKMKANGFAPKLRKVPIKSGGDIIVGQEYTDFDKGLDDGIEGDISGFNFVLASTFNNANVKHQVKPLRPINNLFKRDLDRSDILHDPFFAENKGFTFAMNPQHQKQGKALSRRQIWDESLEFYSMNRLMPPLPLDNAHEDVYKSQRSQEVKFPEPNILSVPVYKPQISNEAEFESKISNTATVYKPQILHESGHKLQSFSDYLHKPLGLLLIELSNDCGYLRGAPLSGKGVLVSWTRTNVRVFGGAILKTVPPFCVK